jgi:UDP-N-acetylmuramate--alanine ligase
MTRLDIDLRALVQAGPVHFVGAGGAGMCALAELVLRSGGQVSGCDLKDGPALRALAELGVRVHVGHDAEHAHDAAALVVTSAVPATHVELLAAHERGIPVLKRAQALGAWVNTGTLVAVAGTHGKTTTTAMATEMLAAAGRDPTGLVGGRVVNWGGNLRFGAQDLFVVEADEYDRSFHTLTPDVAVVTNLEADHLDIYGDLGGVREGFLTFLRGLRSGGRIAVCADDPGASALLGGLGPAGYSYGTSAGTQLRATDISLGSGGTTFRIMEDGADRGPFTMSLGGRHNLLNGLGAAAAVRHLGVEWKDIGAGLSEFRGVGRRFEHVGEVGGVTIVDDYAHHPTEIRATLQALKDGHADRRLVAVFQPHLYSRTRDFHEEFGAALALADIVWVTDVFPAREAPIPGITGAMVADAARGSGAGDVRYHATLDDLPDALAQSMEPGDLLVTLGAGSVESVARDVKDLLEATVHA